MSEESYPGELEELRAIVMLVRDVERQSAETTRRINEWLEKLSGENSPTEGNANE